jgi:hypothetical protein
VIEMLGQLLEIACENQSTKHYNYLCVNVDALFEAAKEHLVNANDNGGGDASLSGMNCHSLEQEKFNDTEHLRISV